MSLLSVRPASLFLVLGLCATVLGGCLRPSTSPDVASESRDSETAYDQAVSKQAVTSLETPLEFSHTSSELMEKLTIGWNLGNSLDVPEGETGWGNPVIHPDLLKAVRWAGFRIVRVPVTWTKHMGPGPHFVIEEDWIKRVREVVGYAHAAGLYTVIDVHHDGADGFEGAEWLTLNDANGETNEENNARVKARFVAVWQQIAAAFKDYGEELLFESMNEIHDGYGQPDPRHIEFINELNQTFVRLVRASGGNNDRRHLVVPGYNTNIEHTIAGFRVPEDSTPGRLILSVHFYDPYLFALQAQVHTWGANSPGRDDWGQEEHVVSQFDKLEAKFVDQGVPVLMGEYGATHQKGYEDYRRYYMEYVTQAAVQRGIVPVYWDNGGKGSGGENFGLFDRSTGRVLHPEMLDAMMRAATASGSLNEITPPKPSK